MQDSKPGLSNLIWTQTLSLIHLFATLHQRRRAVKLIPSFSRGPLPPLTFQQGQAQAQAPAPAQGQGTQRPTTATTNTTLPRKASDRPGKYVGYMIFIPSIPLSYIIINIINAIRLCLYLSRSLGTPVCTTFVLRTCTPPLCATIEPVWDHRVLADTTIHYTH